MEWSGEKRMEMEDGGWKIECGDGSHVRDVVIG